MSFSKHGSQTEEQLYQCTLQHFETIKQKWRDAGLSRNLYYPVTYRERILEHQHLFVLGEAHGSIMPVEYAHEHLVPVIRQNPPSWLFLMERLHDKDLADPSVNTTGFYFRELADLFDITKEEALVDLYDADGRRRIREKSGLSDRLIDELLLGQILPGFSLENHTILAAWDMARRNNRPMDREFASYGKRLAQDLADFLKKPLEYTLELYAQGSTQCLDFVEALGKPWNECSKERFHEIRAQYKDKQNILVHVGEGHLPVFLE